jgi:hypothetical protein
LKERASLADGEHEADEEDNAEQDQRADAKLHLSFCHRGLTLARSLHEGFVKIRA